ncbi:MAG TPA: cyanophycin synthetase, partial [Gillisia sp.]|nr:cyanophycin synthetase [Gillisia sp.]
QATITSETSNIAVSLACDKVETKYLLEQAQIPVPAGEILSKEEHLQEVVDNIGYPLVTKPLDGNHGRGISININTYEDALKGFRKSKEISDYVLVERQTKGNDYRLLVVNNKFVAAAKRTPAHVIGDGKLSIRELLDKVNSDPRRGVGHEQILTKISLDDSTLDILNSQSLKPESILEKDRKLILKNTANLSTGGTSTDVTDIVHPENIFMAERIATIIGLDICGIDIMTRDIKEPIANTGGVVLEVNAGPGFRMHLNPSSGLPRNVAAPVIDKLFPNNSTGTIPIIAITGTNGKTTTTRLIAHIARQEGYRVGYTTTDGVYIQNRLLMKGDCTGPVSAQFVLKDPTVNFAVLECARGGLLRAGLGFNNCDIGIVTNVTEDHLGLNGIHSVEQLAKVKSIIPESVKQDGYSVLNADDDLVYEMRSRVISKVALFSMDENNPRIKKMQEEGGLTAVYENGYITICKGEWKLRVTKAINIPLTFGGKAKFMIQNVLPAVLAAHIKGISLNDIEVALQTFMPSPSQTPGRLNLFQFRNFQLLMDYAHNPSGMKALKEFTDEIPATYKVGIITGVGDRKKEDMIEVGRISAEMFDEVIIRQDQHLRGRSADEIISNLREGIEQHDPSKKTMVIKDEKEAVTYAIENARKGSLIVICSELIKEVTRLIQELREEDQELNHDTNGREMSPAS